MSVTIKDVARHAGVSISTVSKVLNKKPYISQDALSKVNQAISELGYIPNSQAAGLARKKTRNIVFLTSLPEHIAYSDPHMFDIMCGVHDFLARKNYTMSISDINISNSENIANSILYQSADGMIVHGTALNKQVSGFLLKHNFPHIVIGSPEDPRLCWVDTNHELGSKIAAEHLINCGYRKIGFIGEKNLVSSISGKRLSGFITAMKDADIPIIEKWILHADTSSAILPSEKNLNEGYSMATQLLEADYLPEAVICSNNLLAYGFYKVAAKKSIRIPEDIALITFDQYPYTSIMRPMPTYVHIDLRYMGHTAARLLLQKISNPDLHVQAYTTLPKLSVNATTPQRRRQEEK